MENMWAGEERCVFMMENFPDKPDQMMMMMDCQASDLLGAPRFGDSNYVCGQSLP